MGNSKLSVILGNVGACCDRYMSGGYQPQPTVEQLFEKVASIEGVTGVELVSNWHINKGNHEQVRGLLKSHKLELVSIIPDHFGTPKWGKGAFTSKNPQIRKDAVSYTKELIDVAKDLGGNLISLWPGQDGYDYHFQADYIKERGWFEEGVQACAEYDKNFKIAVEYKPKEPRIRSYASTVYSTLLMVKEIGLSNVGITMDFGHAIMGYENAAESVAVLSKYGDKLFHMHMNDAFGLWDDDMICGTVHTVAFFELFYWLKKTGYSGFISTDQYPYREDGKAAVEESIKWMQLFTEKVNELPSSEVEAVIDGGDGVEVSRLLRKWMFGQGAL